MNTFAIASCCLPTMIGGLPQATSSQDTAMHPDIWKSVSCSALVQTLRRLSNVSGVTVNDTPGNPVYVFQVEYQFSPRLAMPKGLYTVSLYPSQNIVLEQERRVNRRFSSIPNPPKMVDLTKTFNVQGFSLFDDVPSDPLFNLGWAAFVRVAPETKIGLEMKIVTSGHLNLDEDGRPVYLADGKPDRLPLAKEHSILAAAILKEVFEQGKRLKVWKGE